MDFLGIGVPEVVVIIILALIFIGPRDLPRIAARLGKFLRDIRMMSEGFTTEWRREMAALSQVEELKELKEELTSTGEALQDAGREIKGTMRIEAEDLEPDSPQSSETRTATATTGNASDGDSDSQAEEVEAEAATSTSIPETSDQKTQNMVEEEEVEPETSTSPQSQAPSLSDEKVEEAETVTSVTTAETSDQETQNAVEEEATEPEISALHASQAQTNTSLPDDNIEAATAESAGAQETADQDPQNAPADEDNENEEDLETRTIHPPHPVASVSPTDVETNQSSDHQVNAPSKHNGQTTDEVEVKSPKSATTEEPSGSE